MKFSYKLRWGPALISWALMATWYSLRCCSGTLLKLTKTPKINAVGHAPPHYSSSDYFLHHSASSNADGGFIIYSHTNRLGHSSCRHNNPNHNLRSRLWCFFRPYRQRLCHPRLWIRKPLPLDCDPKPKWTISCRPTARPTQRNAFRKLRIVRRYPLR